MLNKLVPRSFKELSEKLDQLDNLGSEDISFLLGALIYLASRSAGLFHRDKSPTERFSLFMKFASCVDPRLDPSKTLKNYSGKFLNYAMSKVRGDKDISCLSSKALSKLTEVLMRELSSDNARKVVIGMMGVRDVSYLYVYFYNDSILEALFNSSKEGFGCLSDKGGGSSKGVI